MAQGRHIGPAYILAETAAAVSGKGDFMKKIMEKFLFQLKNSRVLRTFIQSAAGYIVANVVYISFSPDESFSHMLKVLLYTLIIPAAATGLAAVMNSTGKAAGKGEDDDSLHI